MNDPFHNMQPPRRLRTNGHVRVAGAILLAVLWSAAARAQPRVLRVPSAVLGEPRVVHVQLPPNYALAKQRYPVTVLLDGHVRAFFDITVAAADYNLTGDLHPVAMSPQIIVAVEHPSRSSDLGTNAALFLRFLTDELLPRIDREYRTLPFRTLIGHSLGGRFALTAICRAPNSFQAVVAASPSLPDSVQQEVVQCVGAPRITGGMRHLVLSAGSLEPRSLTNTERLHQELLSLKNDAWRLYRVDATGLEHTGTPLVTIPLELRFVFDGNAWDLSAPWRDSLFAQLGDPEQVLTHGLADRAQRLGVNAPASARMLTRVVQTWLARRNAERALAAARELVAQYPEEILSHTLLVDAYDLANDAPNARKALQTTLDMSNRIAWFDESQKQRFQTSIRSQLSARAP